MRPEATEFMTLQFIQDWTESYTDTENIGLVITKDPGQGGSALGVYIFESWSGKKGARPAR